MTYPIWKNLLYLSDYHIIHYTLYDYIIGCIFAHVRNSLGVKLEVRLGKGMSLSAAGTKASLSCDSDSRKKPKPLPSPIPPLTGGSIVVKYD
jgi:hypothetical protein